ncbi:MAG TPA: flavin reductase family protein, partial [Thermomicrobiales bacterium]|nr:flavin reductase family protein [Thermomicrobiales bacterium]
FATGVTVVTTRHGEQFYGMTANAVASLSLDPPQVLVAVDRRAQMHEALLATRFFAINVLSERQEDLSRRFAMRGPKEWADLQTTTAVTGAPIFAGALAYLDCRLAEVLPGGDHQIFIGEIVGGDAGDGRPLMYYRGDYVRLPE